MAESRAKTLQQKMAFFVQRARYHAADKYRLFKDMISPPKEPGEELVGSDFIADADRAISTQTPRGSATIVWGSILAVMFLLFWAGCSKIDEVTKGEAKVVPSQNVQVIQSLDGGIVAGLHVREGQAVKKGQLLLNIDPTRFSSYLSENRVQYLALNAKVSRLRAIAEGKAFIPPADVLKEAPELIEQERSLYSSKRSELDAVLAIARLQVTQRTEELREVKSKKYQAEETLRLTEREYQITKPMLASGAVSDIDILRLEKDIARLRGELNVTSAQIPRIEASIAESYRKIQESDLNFRNQARQELSETVAKLNALSASGIALEDRVKQSDIRSPVNGVVKQIFSNTIGGVVQPGKDIIEIVPSDDTLLLETKVLPKDIAFLRPGLRAVVKFTAYDFSIYGGLEGTLESISADTVTDPKGNSFYIATVRTNKNAVSDKNMPIIPGMVAEVNFVTGKKSVLSYLMKPIMRAHQDALTER